MIIFPAIDLKDGSCVRLVQGDYATAHKVAENPLETAKGFYQNGARWIHMVDLDGAKAGQPVNSRIILDVVRDSHLRVEVGGGIRTMENVAYYLESGVCRVILGSAALRDPEFVKEAVRRYGDQIAVGIDAKDGMVAVEGWTETSAVDYLEMAKSMEKIGVKYLIYTDISKDGTLAGPNLVQLDRLNSHVSCKVTASGGVGNLKDIINLQALNVYGAICGKALYTGDLDLSAAVQISGGVK